MPRPGDAVKTYEAVLKEFLSQNPSIQPITSSDPAEIGEFIVKKAPDGTARVWLSKLMAQETSFWARNGLGVLMLSAAGMLAGMALLYGIFLRPDFLKSMAVAGGARGLITFLFAFATISVVIIAVIASFWVDIDEVEKRGAIAKEILTILIGIMGTILGFYFGSVDSGPAPEPSEVEAPASQ